MTLIEMADGYTKSIVLVKLAIEEKQEEIVTAPAKRRDTLRLELNQLRLILRDLQEVRKTCLTYYTEDRNPRYCYRTGGR